MRSHGDDCRLLSHEARSVVFRESDERSEDPRYFRLRTRNEEVHSRLRKTACESTRSGKTTGPGEKHSIQLRALSLTGRMVRPVQVTSSAVSQKMPAALSRPSPRRHL